MSQAAHQKAATSIRRMMSRDLQEVLAIERTNFGHPWSKDQFIQVLRQRNCIGKVAEHDDRIVAFMIYEFFPRKIHIHNLAVHYRCQRNGIGSEMVDTLIRILSANRRNRITAVVRETNLPAQQFFRRCGFLATVVLRGYWDCIDEDGYEMTYRRHWARKFDPVSQPTKEH